jgi:hypothetical protein
VLYCVVGLGRGFFFFLFFNLVFFLLVDFITTLCNWVELNLY